MTTQDSQLPELPENRPTMAELVDDTPLRERIMASARSIRQALALAGTLILVLGALIWIFVRDLETYSYIVMGIGLVILIVDAGISFDAVRYAIFGRRGRYGLNTAIVLIAFVAIAIVLNFVIYWAVGRPDPPGFLRIDTTSTKQFIVSDATLNTLSNLREPIQVTAFFRRNTPQRQAAWRATEDLLSEFKRRSTERPLSFRLVDPELEPNVASEYGITQFPSLAIEATDSRRTEVIPGLNPNTGPNVFSEQDVITGLLVVNQIKQKTIIFISGHAVRDLLDSTRDGDGYALAAESLVRENYAIANETLQELGQRLSSNNPELLPAAIIFAGPDERDDRKRGKHPRGVRSAWRQHSDVAGTRCNARFFQGFLVSVRCWRWRRNSRRYRELRSSEPDLPADQKHEQPATGTSVDGRFRRALHARIDVLLLRHRPADNTTD